MRRVRFRAFLVVLAYAVFSAAGALAQHAPAAQRVIDRARAASGGAAWNGVRGLHETGAENGAAYERWLDVLRYGERLETQAVGAAKAAQGYNGFGVWGGRQEGRAEDILARARSEAFFAAYGYYFPGRFDLRSGYVGARQAGGRAFEVIWVEPAGGEARDLWFDRRTGLLDRMAERGRPRPRTIEVSDYRRVGRLLLPFAQKTYGGDPAVRNERQAARIESAAPDRALFSLARPR